MARVALWHGRSGFLSLLALVACTPMAAAQSPNSSAAAAPTAAGSGAQQVAPGTNPKGRSSEADASGKPAVVRYNLRAKGGTSARDGAAAAPTGPLETVCSAGCSQQPGTAIHVQAAAQPATLLAEARTIPAGQAAPDAGCIAACDDGSSGRGNGSFNAHASHRFSKSGVAESGSKGQSGSWLDRINRERSQPQRQ